MTRYVQDITGEPARTPSAPDGSPSPWERALSEARQALAEVGQFLFPSQNAAYAIRQSRRAGGLTAQRLDAATAALTTGRDLLHTHFTSAPGHPRPRSEWSSLITSAPVSQALLTEIGALAHQAATLTLASQPTGNDRTRQQLTAACRRLQTIDTAARTAYQQQPIGRPGHDLLRAIPVNMLPPPRTPTGRESVAELCAGAIRSATRLRRLAWTSAQQPAWSPDLNITSLRQVAATSTITSHNCHAILLTLADWAAQHREPDLGAELTASAAAAGHARQQWLEAARGLEVVTTDSAGHVSPAAAESSTLATWIGRLAHADPAWTLSNGSNSAPRIPASLIASPEDLPHVVAAIHHACEALSLTGRMQAHEVLAAGFAHRILVPTRSLPGRRSGIPRLRCL